MASKERKTINFSRRKYNYIDPWEYTGFLGRLVASRAARSDEEYEIVYSAVVHKCAELILKGRIDYAKPWKSFLSRSAWNEAKDVLAGHRRHSGREHPLSLFPENPSKNTVFSDRSAWEYLSDFTVQFDNFLNSLPTDRERSILRYLKEGYNLRECGELMGWSASKTSQFVLKRKQEWRKLWESQIES